MKTRVKKWLTFMLRWGIAVAGIWWVLANTSFQDRVKILRPGNELVSLPVMHSAKEDAGRFEIHDKYATDPAKHRFHVNRDQIWTQPYVATAKIADASGQVRSVKVLGMRPGAHLAPGETPVELLIRDPKTGKPETIDPNKVIGGYVVPNPYPLVEIGLVRLVREANPVFLLAALLILPISFLVTSRRWHVLLAAMDIHLSQSRTFVLNMVGAFYNTFMPGSTGGDLIKAYYAAKHTTHKVRAVLSVIVDRVIGLLALIMLGGVMASLQWHVPDCRRVAVTCAFLILAAITGLSVYYHPTWRRLTGLDWLLKRLPMQRHIHHAIEAMDLYGRRPVAAGKALVMTFPVHVTTIMSAWLAGQAFGIPMSFLYYWTVVPVLALVGAIPISPQGVGVMEGFAVLLTQRQGVPVSQAIALAMSIRVGQMFWNLVAGVFVLRGGYHAIGEKEQEELEQDSDEEGGDQRSEVRGWDSSGTRADIGSGNGEAHSDEPPSIDPANKLPTTGNPPPSTRDLQPPTSDLQPPTSNP